jgi:parallel beta-helix repeat protein
VSGNVIRNNSALITGGLEYHGNLLIEGNEVTDNSGSGIVGQSEEGTTLRHNTVLDNSKTGITLTCRSLVLVEDNVIARNQLEGIHRSSAGGGTLFITGNLLEANQSGISLSGGFSVTVARNRIVGSTAKGAVLGVTLQTTVEDNFVAFNQDGGIWMYGSSSAVVARNHILSNQGLGLEVSGNSVLIINNYVHDNRQSSPTRDGAGIAAFPGHGGMSIINNTVVANVGTGYGCGLYSTSSHTPIVRNNIFWHNQGVSEIYPENLDVAHCDVEGGYPGTGNIDADPRFVDEQQGDLHLLATSPCIDAGVIEKETPDRDAEGDPRVAPDMGADEFFPHLYFTGIPARGKVIDLKVVGPPGVGPVKMFVSAAFLDVPLPTPWGDWYLVFPVVRLVLGTLSDQGLIDVHVEIPDWLPPMLIATQAFVPAQLTNPFPLQIE